MPNRSVQKAKVVALSIFAAIAYGILHDQVTAHLCVEYFSVAHPPFFHTDSPTVLAFCWGIFATVGIGAVLGAILAETSQSEGLPPYPIPRLCRSLLRLLATMAIAACLAGVLGFELSRHSVIALPATFADLIPPARRDCFMAVWFAHCASYLAGLSGGTFLILRIWRQRGKPPVLNLIPRSKLAIIRASVLGAVVILILYIRFLHS